MSGSGRSPVSFRVHVRRLPKKGLPVLVEADEAQRAALAEAHGLLAVENFTADLLVKAWKAEGVSVTGRVMADIVQKCVVTLDPLAARVDEAVEGLFLPAGSRLAIGGWAAEGEMHLSAEGPDAPETFSGDEIDVGALAEEFFGLGIHPYPRKPGAAAPAEGRNPDETRSPFADLGSLFRKS